MGMNEDDRIRRKNKEFNTEIAPIPIQYHDEDGESNEEDSDIPSNDNVDSTAPSKERCPKCRNTWIWCRCYCREI